MELCGTFYVKFMELCGTFYVKFMELCGTFYVKFMELCGTFGHFLPRNIWPCPLFCEKFLWNFMELGHFWAKKPGFEKQSWPEKTIKVP